MLRMCGRYELHTPIEEVARRFDAMLTERARRCLALSRDRIRCCPGGQGAKSRR
jgi:hypothetical protein